MPSLTPGVRKPATQIENSTEEVIQMLALCFMYFFLFGVKMYTRQRFPIEVLCVE